MLIYVITDRRLRPHLPLLPLVEQVAGSGADMIQIREKDLDAAKLLDCARHAVEIAGRAGPEVFVNSRPDVALSAGAAGVHLPAAGLPASSVTGRWGGRLKVGVSTHSLREAADAAAAGADFITCGPVFDTPSKRAWGSPVGTGTLREVVASAGVPVFAIGGVNAGTIARLEGIPVAGVAVISAVLESPDMAEAVARLRREAA